MTFDELTKLITETIYKVYPFTTVYVVPSLPAGIIVVEWFYMGKRLAKRANFPLSMIEREGDFLAETFLHDLSNEMSDLIVNDGRLKDSDVR